MSATLTPPQILKAIDQNNEKINIGAYQDSSGPGKFTNWKQVRS